MKPPVERADVERLPAVHVDAEGSQRVLELFAAAADEPAWTLDFDVRRGSNALSRFRRDDTIYGDAPLHDQATGLRARDPRPLGDGVVETQAVAASYLRHRGRTPGISTPRVRAA